MSSLDAALEELGMLSAAPEIRREFLRERARAAAAQRQRERLNSEPVAANCPPDNHGDHIALPKRERKISEPPINDKSSPIRPKLGMSVTPNNSPAKGFHVLHINPTFVSNLMLSPGRNESRLSKRRDAHCMMLDERLNQENQQLVYKRVRISRHAKRFRKPYEPPWLQGYSKISRVDSFTATPTELAIVQTDGQAGAAGDSTNDGSQAVPRSGGHHVQVHTAISAPCDTNNSSQTVAHPVARSKSLDHLDFAKLRLAEQENQNYLQERKDIETVSQHLQNLNVSE